jgi:Domain of Unknown Function (DUF1080)
MKNILLPFFLIASLSSSFAQNKLTPAEKAAGWKLLFDGKTTKGWHSYNKTTIGSAWKVKNGTMMLDTTIKDGWQVKDGGDIVTNESFDNYDFKVDWKISNEGNSGIIFNVKEDPSLEYVWHSGPEMQIADKNNHDGKLFKHKAADLYDLIPCSKEVAKFGAWNTARIVNKRGLLKLYLNGTKVVETRIDGQAWKDLIAGSKFKDMPEFGKYLGGHLSLQDHGAAVWFRNIKIRKL